MSTSTVETRRDKTHQALAAMNQLGITRAQAKPVLRALVRVYDNDWSHIEAENYRVLIDAIYDPDFKVDVAEANGSSPRSDSGKGKAVKREDPQIRPDLEMEDCGLFVRGGRELRSQKKLRVDAGTDVGPSQGIARMARSPDSGVARMARSPDSGVARVSGPPARVKPRAKHDVHDLSRGLERVKISVVNEITSEELPPSFHYIKNNTVYENAHISFPLARIGDENCCIKCYGDCLASRYPCECARETGGEFAYERDGRLKSSFLEYHISLNRETQRDRLIYCNGVCPLERNTDEDEPELCKGHPVKRFIKECWTKCGCHTKCGNRVMQRGITYNLQVYYVNQAKGWGLRPLSELPKGAFVCEYVGEILTNMELYNRQQRTTGKDKHTYPVNLDADWGAEGCLKDDDALCLDGTFYGNVARFINHRCTDGNLIAIPVEVETPDHHYYHVAFFTTRKVGALEELTWDYQIDFDDHKHPIKAFRCFCGSKYCRERNPKK